MLPLTGSSPVVARAFLALSPPVLPHPRVRCTKGLVLWLQSHTVAPPLELGALQWGLLP